LSLIREKREKEFKELEAKTKELEGARKGLLNILEDVAEARQEAEEERNKTLAIITNFTDGLLVFDEQKKLSLINPQAESFLSIKSDKVLGKTLSSMSRMSGPKLLVNLLGKDINPVFREELKLHEDLILEVSVILIPREDEDESLIVLHDTTREKLVERMKTEFVSITAHQLRTPLSAIKWTLNMLLGGDLGKITKEQREFIGKTYQSNERMISLINDLLSVTRIEEGRYVYNPVLSNMTKLVQSLIDQCKDQLGARNINLEFEKPKKELPQVLIDVEKINLAVQNLLDNAIRYNRLGGSIKISLKSNKKEIQFSIKDSGVGIPKKQEKRIFTKFFRASNVMRMETEGSGLGLFIVKNIIEAHKGRIWFKSKEGKGTTFHFTLPVPIYK
jgi:two-component system sensor histidine kinase VicK